MRADSTTPPSILIAPESRDRRVDLRELWQHRGLLVLLAGRDLRVRYKQAVFGAGWAVMQPFTTMVLFSVLFHRMGRFPATGNVPYPVLAFCGLVPWTFFANALGQASLSLVANPELVTKVYFPRELIPMAPVITAAVDFCVAFVVLLGMMLWFHVEVPASAIAVAPLLVFVALTVMALSLWSSALTLLYRDLRFIVPFLIQIGFMVTPVIWETGKLVPERWHLVAALNPMATAIDGFRWAMLGSAPVRLSDIVVSVAVTAALLAMGHRFFRRTERSFADRI